MSSNSWSISCCLRTAIVLCKLSWYVGFSEPLSWISGKNEAWGRAAIVLETSRLDGQDGIRFTRVLTVDELTFCSHSRKKNTKESCQLEIEWHRRAKWHDWSMVTFVSFSASAWLESKASLAMGYLSSRYSFNAMLTSVLEGDGMVSSQFASATASCIALRVLEPSLGFIYHEEQGNS